MTSAPPEGPGTFLLGVGCQKGGTAWMHRYLEASPQCRPGFRKEYHVWDSVDLPTGQLARKRILSAAERARKRDGGGDVDRMAVRRAVFLDHHDQYFDYFSRLLAMPGTRLTADITPAYAELSVQRLEFIRREFRARDIRPATVYLMRDPVERVWSACRMDLQRRGETDPAAAEERVRRMHKHEMYAARTRYDETLARLDEAFPADDVFVGFYETLFDRSTLASLCSFLGIDFHEPDFDRQVNVSPKQADLSDDVVRTVATYFAPVYDAVAARFPDLDLAELWPSMRLAGR